MAVTIKLKNASGSDPSASDLVLGELAVRTDNGKIFLKKDNGSVAEVSGGGGVDDGDKGDITVSNSGDTWTIDNDAITQAKIADDAVGTDQIATSSIVTNRLNDDAVTYAKIQNVSATDRVLGRDSSGAGVIEEIRPSSLRTMINVEDGATADQTAAEIKTLLNSNGIVNAQVDASAAIAGTKISPDFGSQNITTTGDATINGGDLTVTGGEGTSASLKLVADQGDDNGDGWRINSNQDDNDLTFANNTSGSYVDKLTLKNDGNLDVTGGVDVTGNITVSGTVDGRDLATDGTKLDGIEANATADQSASEILTAIKTVDGSGSGLDADTVDGNHGSAFPILSNSNSFTNSYNEFGNGTGSVSNNGSWNGRVNVAGSSHARIDAICVSDSIHTTMYAHTGHGAGRVGTMSDHQLELMCNGTSRATLSTGGQLQTTIQGILWGASNDGSGSGLDADTVDGIQASSFLRSDTDDTCSYRIVFANCETDNHDDIDTATAYHGAFEVYNVNSGNDAFFAFHTANDFACYFGLDAGINDLAVGGWSFGANSYRIWHEGNDGSSSGLDADKLDGYHAAEAATGSTVVARDGDGDINGRYFEGDWVKCRTTTNSALSSSNIDGGGGFVVAAESGWYYHQSPSAVRSLLNVADGATNVTNNNQLTNGAGYVTSSGAPAATGARVWANVEGDAGTPYFRDSYGCSSLTDISYAVQQINFSTNFSNSNYCFVSGARAGSSGGGGRVVVGYDQPATSYFQYQMRNLGNNNEHVDAACLSFFGDM